MNINGEFKLSHACINILNCRCIIFDSEANIRSESRVDSVRVQTRLHVLIHVNNEASLILKPLAQICLIVGLLLIGVQAWCEIRLAFSKSDLFLFRRAEMSCT